MHAGGSGKVRRGKTRDLLADAQYSLGHRHIAVCDNTAGSAVANMLITAERTYIDGAPRNGVGICVGRAGMIEEVGQVATMGTPDVSLDRRLLLPGFVNAHSHAFQRLLRGRTQRAGGREDDFWTWRQAMYLVANRLDPQSVYVASRQAFIEMLLCGVTAVGEFYYVHHRPDGTPYEEPTAMAEAVARAALDAGIRLCFLRSVCLRGDFDAPPAAQQRRFVDGSLDGAWKHIEAVIERLRSFADPRITWGIAAHSIRAVPIEAIVALKTCAGHLPLHLHISEQQREVDGCLRTYGVPPVELMARHAVLDATTTLIHATHLGAGEARAIAASGAGVCVCPSTEADLGDGLAPVRDLFALGVPLSLGTDGQTKSSILCEAARLEMHERLRCERRNILARAAGDSTASFALEAATINGARALDIPAGRIAAGRWADFSAINLDDPHLAGWDDDSLVAALLFSADARAVSDVFVGGERVVTDGRHAGAAASAAELAEVSTRVFSSGCS